MSEDGTKPLTVFERMYIKNEEVIAKYEDILFSTVYYCYYAMNARHRMFEPLYDNIDYIDNNLRENLKELFNSSPYKSHFEGYSIDYLYEDRGYALSYIENILWAEIEAYGRLENEEGDQPIIRKEERDKLFSKALLVVSLIAFDCVKYKIKPPFSEVNVGDLCIKTLTEIDNIELVKYNMDILSREGCDKEKDKMINYIHRDVDRFIEITEQITYSYGEYIFTNQDLVECIVDRFEKETDGILSEHEIVDTIYLPYGTVKVITPYKLSQYMYLHGLEKYNIRFSIGSYFNSIYKVLICGYEDDDIDDDCRYRWTWKDE